MDLFFSTGQAARELGVSPATIRALCAAGAIEAQSTPGGQYRISRAVVEKLKQTGLPNVPRPLPVGYGPGQKKNGNARLLAPPSEDLIDSTEDLVATENLLKKRKLERELEETEDWFRQRQEELDERLAEQEREERIRRAEEQAEEERAKWLRDGESCALRSLAALAYDAPPEIRLAVHQAVRDRLTRLDPIPAKDVTQRLINSEVQKAVSRWRCQQQIEEILLEVRDRRLPSGARRSWSSDPWSPWQFRGANAASDAMQKEIHKGVHDLDALRAVAYQAADAVKEEFLHQQRCDAAQREVETRTA
jgi:excisionase family DNA binding protein